MPWKAVKEKEQFCVYKEDAEGKPAGKTLGCHPTKAKADAQLAALYANEPQAERAVSLHDIYQQVNDAVEASASEGMYPWLNDIYDDNGQLFAIITAGGKLYRMPLMMDGPNVVLGSLTEVEAQFQPITGGQLRIIRQKDGRYRWFALAETSVLNRVGEIDSTVLFDSFVAGTKEAGYPQLDFYHDARLRMGETDYLARDENVLLASGLLDAESPLAMAFVDAVDKGRGTWGCSVAFLPTERPQMLRVAEGVTIPVYVAGVLRAITILPEDRAASWFTSASVEVTRMKTEVQSAIRLLYGDDGKADAFIAAVEAANEEIRERGLVTREDKPEAAVEPVAEEAPKTEEAPKVEEPTEEAPVEEVREAPAAEAEQAPVAPVQAEPQTLVLDESALAAIVEAVKAGITMPSVDLSPLTAQLQAIGGRIDKLERSEDQKRREWQADLPARRQVTVTTRPRVTQAPEAQPDATPGKLDLAAKAAATLAKMPRQR